MDSQVAYMQLPTTSGDVARRFERMAREHVKLIGRRIRERRKELGIGPTELARRLPGKVDTQQLYRWERGVHRPNDDTLESLARVLEVSVGYFFADEPDKTATPDPFEADVQTKLDRILTALDRAGLLTEREAKEPAAVPDRVLPPLRTGAEQTPDTEQRPQPGRGRRRSQGS